MLYVMLPLMTPLFSRWLYPRDSGEKVDEDTDPQRRG
jgi:antibiotic biosynthesis monooxygenase (ABM) superfamily enzyme